MKARTIKTVWELATYDVWGNAKDGYEVNDVYRHSGKFELLLAVEVCNPGTPQQFETAHPTDAQLRKALGLGKTRLETSGDDTTIYINRARDNYPLGELTCLSHDSLSPIREAKEEQ